MQEKDINMHMQALYQLIQNGIKKKSLNTIALSQKIGMERKQLKKILSQQAPLTIQDFLRISHALDLQDTLMQNMPQDLPVSPNPDDTPTIALAGQNNEDVWKPDALGNHAEQLISMGFALGCNMLLLCQTSLLANSNVPKAVLERFKPRIPIQLEAQYHPYNKPQFYPEGLEIRLSFDALYTCFFPWGSIEQVSFFPKYDEPSEDSEGDNKPDRPTLRLV